MPDSTVTVRLAHADDDDFILGLVPRFAEFELPAWRKRNEILAGTRRDIEHHLRTLPPASHLFVADDANGERAGFLHLLTRKDYFTGAQNCHIGNIAVAAAHERKGVAAALLRHAETWAKQHRCRHLTLSVFPENGHARVVYEKHGFGVELLSMAKLVK